MNGILGWLLSANMVPDHLTCSIVIGGNEKEVFEVRLCVASKADDNL